MYWCGEEFLIIVLNVLNYCIKNLLAHRMPEPPFFCCCRCCSFFSQIAFFDCVTTMVKKEEKNTHKLDTVTTPAKDVKKKARVVSPEGEKKKR